MSIEDPQGTFTQEDHQVNEEEFSAFIAFCALYSNTFEPYIGGLHF